jgi:hypothetical protein
MHRDTHEHDADGLPDPATIEPSALQEHAERLSVALAGLLSTPDLNMDELEEETRRAMRTALFALERYEALRYPTTLDRCCLEPCLKWRGTIENAAIECQNCGFVLADDGQLADWHDPEQRASQRDQIAERL